MFVESINVNELEFFCEFWNLLLIFEKCLAIITNCAPIQQHEYLKMLTVSKNVFEPTNIIDKSWTFFLRGWEILNFFEILPIFQVHVFFECMNVIWNRKFI